MVIFGPKLKGMSLKLDIWPWDPAQKKVENEIAQVGRANFNARFLTWDDNIDNLSPEKLIFLLSKFDSKLEAAKIKLVAMKGIRDHPPTPRTCDLISAAFPPKNLSDNHLQSHSPFKTFDHIQAIPHNSLDYGLFMGQHDLEITSNIIIILGYWDVAAIVSYPLLRSSLTFSSHHHDHQGIVAYHDPMHPMQDNLMFKQPKPYDAWFPPGLPKHHASSFDQLYSESNPIQGLGLNSWSSTVT
ncbi:hypothetical protein COLO4_35569 [Corchorus olitorius]|uniref:Uncharacterized protein n=1 Tax=Corchorus olitorius TaxID=93759 RepID=A0A1R3GF51_9ROSI|nr:hypothetical protein COLO4_35569 [Corchorus olitorius]